MFMGFKRKIRSINLLDFMQSFLEKNQNGHKLNLSQMKELDAIFGYPSKKFKTIHIAGTNGKGSVTTKIASALFFSNYKVGLYTSPHISNFNERIKVNGRKIPEKKLMIYFSQIYEKAKENNIAAGFFEIMTLVSFLYFAEKKVEVAVIEAGLGGRLDATNIISPLLSVITSISFDHTAILGNTLEKIAFEKAGIIKPSIPIIIGPAADFQSIREKAKKSASQLIKSAKTEGSFDDQNSEIAKDALLFFKEKFLLSDIAIQKGLKKRPECRFETFFLKKSSSFKKLKCFPKTLVLDVAHNPDGFRNLFQTAKRRFPNSLFRIVMGISKSKDIKACIAEVLDFSSNIHLIDGHERLISKEDLFQLFPKDKKLNIFCKLSLPLELKNALALAGKNNEILLVCGSFFIMRSVKEILGLKTI